NHLDLNLAADNHLSYLKAMPEEARDFLRRGSLRNVIPSGDNIVNRNYRRTRIGRTLISVALPGAVIALFERRPELDLCIGMPLVACANHRTLERLGMKDMHRGNITIHNVQAKFMHVTRDAIDLGEYGDDIRAVMSPYLTASGSGDRPPSPRRSSAFAMGPGESILADPLRQTLGDSR